MISLQLRLYCGHEHFNYLISTIKKIIIRNYVSWFNLFSQLDASFENVCVILCRHVQQNKQKTLKCDHALTIHIWSGSTEIGHKPSTLRLCVRHHL